MIQLEKIVAPSGTIDGATLRERILRAAGGMAGLGVRAGDRVAILMRNDLAQLEATLATQHLGAYPVQVNWHAGPDEIRHVLQDCGAGLLVCHADFHPLVRQAVRHPPPTVIVRPAPSLCRDWRIEPALQAVPPGLAEWDSWVAAQPMADTAAATAVESIIYTSGTTGLPKGVRRFAPTPREQALTERMRMALTGIDEGARVLVTAPLYHTAPNLFAMRAVRRAQALVLPPRFDPVEMLADIERHRITHLYAVPTMFVRLLALPADLRKRFDLSSLAVALHAGGPCAPAVKQAMLDWWGPVIHEYYGSTESGPITFVRGDEWLRKPGTVGRAIEGAQLQIQDEQGHALGAGQVGELLVRNDAYPDFTYLNGDAARAALRRGELNVTGDMGYLDEDGYLFLVDRKRDLVISGGVNIYPAEIEAAIQSLPGVADCAVFGIPDDEFGEALAGIVEPLPGAELDAERMRGELARRIARFKVPRVIELCARLPREESGKIKKRLLREPYWAGTGRRI